ncbi:MAG: aminotransferase class IV [Deinococcales bacterium]|nr:aminotransferase class IV [Chitinophagaceae bacterium]
MYLNQNGRIIKEEKAIISPNNRSFRYGDGCFETMKVIDNSILLADYHFERLFASLQLLQFDVPKYLTADYLQHQILEVAKKNYHNKLARVRLTVYRGNGGLYDPENHFPNYLIQTWDLNPANNLLNENGLVVDVFRDAIKVCDTYSHVKSNNYLCYVMAALWAKKHHLNDAILLNPYNRIADATIANIFIITNGIVKTPSVSEGCVSGVMRRYLLTKMRAENIPVEETKIAVEELLQASEIFLTNGIYGIRWVKQICNNNYTNTASSMLYKQFIKPILQHK